MACALAFEVIGPGARYGDYAAGYRRPTAPREFVPLVVGCPTEKIAYAEAQRLAREAEARSQLAFQDHQFRPVASGFYGEES